MLPNRVASLLGLTRRAGKLAPGDWAVTSAIQDGSARVVFLAADAGRSTARRFRGLARQAGIPLYEIGTREELGRTVGLEPKAVLAVTSPELARGIEAALAAGEPEPPSPSGRDRRGT